MTSAAPTSSTSTPANAITKGAPCHQNAAPIFSRQSWDESSANPRIATSLGAAAPGFYALAWRAGVDIPNAIDDATDRANLLPLAAELWREACGTGAAGRA